MFERNDRASLLRRLFRNRRLHNISRTLVQEAGEQAGKLIPGAAGGVNETDANQLMPFRPLRDAPDGEHHLPDVQDDLPRPKCPGGERLQRSQAAAAEAHVEHLAGNAQSFVDECPRRAAEVEAIIDTLVAPAHIIEGG
jgi:hypothetical protein